MFNLKYLRLANDEEVIKYTGYEPGGVCPFDIDIKLYIDNEINGFEKIIVGGGDKKHLIEVYKDDLLKYTDNIIIDIPKKLRDSE